MNFPLHLGVISHKVLYERDGEYYTEGGFPRQMEALKQLFEKVTICAPVCKGSFPEGVDNLTFKGLLVNPLPNVPVASIRDKLLFLLISPYLFWCIWCFCRRVDVVQVRIPNYIGVLGALVMRWQKKPTFVWLAADWPGRILACNNSWYRRLVASFFAWLIPHLLKDWLVFVPEISVLKHARATLVPVVNTSVWRCELPSTTKAVIRNDDHISILYVGRLSPEKGLQHLLEAVARLQSLNWKLTIVGDGLERIQLESQAYRLGIQERVHFIGRLSREKVSEFYKNADILVVPSLNEMSPKVVMEGMAYGLAVIASRVGAIPKLLQDGRGILIEPGSPEHIVSAIKTLAENREMLGKIAQCGLEYAQQHTLDQLNLVMAHALHSYFGLNSERDTR